VNRNLHAKPGSDTNPKASQVHCLASTDPPLASTDPQIAFANEVVAAMKSRLAKDRAMAGMRRGELS
jgi:hypothetical protein